MELIIVTLFLILFLLKFKMRETFWERSKIDLYFYPGYFIACICYLVIIVMYFLRDSEMNMIATLFNLILSLPIMLVILYYILLLIFTKLKLNYL